MGCDIHLYPEKLIDGEWEFIPPYFLEVGPARDRNYALFARLADVRNRVGEFRIEPICEPRGLPMDISRETQMVADKWRDDAHSHSYFTVKELHNKDFPNNELDFVRRFMFELGQFSRFRQPELASDVRVVFWFDN